MTGQILVYDGGNRLFRGIAAVVGRRVDGLTLVCWQDPGVGSFLEAQFDGRPFAFVLVDLDVGTVYAGSEAVRQLVDSVGGSPAVGRAAGQLYPRVADPLGRLLHGRVPADIDGRFDLRAAARPYIETYEYHCTMPPCVD